MIARRRTLLVGFAVAIAGAAVAVVAISAALGWNVPPRQSRDGAERGVARARADDAMHWAPELLDDAETTIRAAAVEWRRQELRLYPFRDFRQARRLYRTADVAATRAADLASRRHDDARGAAARALRAAECGVEETAGIAGALRFGRDAADPLQAARRLVSEARFYIDSGDLGAARASADKAGVESRRARGRMAAALSRFVDPAIVRAWTTQRDETVAWSARTGRAAIVVNKDESSLTLYAAGRPARRYAAEIGLDHLGRKLRAGDEATPEGRYGIVAMQGPGRTVYHRALRLDYPNAEDRRRLAAAVRERRVPPHTGPGALIEIHGEGGRGRDWTRGCISLSNADIDDLYRRVTSGTPVTIIGGDGDGGRFSRAARRLASFENEHVCSEP